MTQNERETLKMAAYVLEKLRYLQLSKDVADLIPEEPDVLPVGKRPVCGQDGYWCHGTCGRHGYCCYSRPTTGVQP